jgi:collagenase-like PrtC family protease
MELHVKHNENFNLNINAIINAYDTIDTPTEAVIKVVNNYLPIIKENQELKQKLFKSDLKKGSGKIGHYKGHNYSYYKNQFYSLSNPKLWSDKTPLKTHQEVELIIDTITNN